MTILNIVIHVTTKHIQKNRECLTTTDYRFFYNGLLGLLVCRLAKRATRNNYKILMSEDRPMRVQRGTLRQRGISFALDDNDIVGFSDTEDVMLNHVDASASLQAYQTWSFSIDDSVGIAIDHHHLLQLAWRDNSLQVFPLICPHEGADLNGLLSKRNCTKKQAMMCPWHGRAIKPLLEIALPEPDVYRFDFCKVNLVLEVLPKAALKGSAMINIFSETP
jgi:nitrite reductase/ring-hydroxylating ferredoxin subunit